MEEMDKEFAAISAMDAGSGSLDIGVAADLVGGYGYADLRVRPSSSVDLFARGEVGMEWDRMDPYGRFMAGLRARW